MKSLQRTFRELLRYPSAVLGLTIIGGFLILSIYAIITIPYSEAIRLWRGGEGIWYQNPKMVAPEWSNLFRAKKLPKTIHLSTLKDPDSKVVTLDSQGNKKIEMTLAFEYPYDAFPQELTLFFSPTYAEKKPHALVSWVMPDGTPVRVADFSTEKGLAYYFSQDTKLQRRLKGVFANVGLFLSDPASEVQVPVKGSYQVKITAYTFEKDADLDAEFVLYGLVDGWAGTDHLRRDLGVALLWGAPIALSFGLIAALGTTITTMVIAAFGVWFGGWVDELIQRITEVNMVLPFLPILIMVGAFYSRSLWVILAVTVLLSIFGASIKAYRSTFLQIKESPYIEAARAYGAGSGRIIFNYLTPRLIPLLIPGLVAAIPGYVFLEAGLAVLGLGDPILPTWGKIINDAQANGALYKGLYYWVLEPAALLMLAGLAFAFLGFSLDRIFNPRLRGM
ncbi:MAG: ABC transporter permease [Anaerolineales bacterium]|nr:ABC transporter permease [Anaerolineales bacterium]